MNFTKLTVSFALLAVCLIAAVAAQRYPGARYRPHGGHGRYPGAYPDQYGGGFHGGPGPHGGGFHGGPGFNGGFGGPGYGGGFGGHHGGGGFYPGGGPNTHANAGASQINTPFGSVSSAHASASAGGNNYHPGFGK